MQKIGYQWFDIYALLMIVLLKLLKRISFNYMPCLLSDYFSCFKIQKEWRPISQFQRPKVASDKPCAKVASDQR
jgi:hypothetical protein